MESCPSHAVRCDGVVDCKMKSDELGCGKKAGHGEARACVRACVCVSTRLCTAYTCMFALATAYYIVECHGSGKAMGRKPEDLEWSRNRQGFKT